MFFAVATEPLAISIRNNPLIKPIQLGNLDHHVSLYADDDVFLSHPEQSVPTLLDIVQSFGKISGYTINWWKSEFMSLGTGLTSDLLANLPFKITDKLKYLGVTLPKDSKQIFKLNFLEKVDNLRKDIDKWRTRPLSTMSRINVIKMVSLPKFVCLFQGLPIFLTKAYFKLLDSIILAFVWGFNVNRISKINFYKPRDGWIRITMLSTLLLGSKC